MCRALLDWLGWERLSTINQRHEQHRKDHETIMAKIATLEATLTEVAAKTTKALGEIRTKVDALNAAIDDLSAQLQNADLPAGAEAKLTELQGLAQALDDIVPDAPDAPAPEGQ